MKKTAYLTLSLAVAGLCLPAAGLAKSSDEAAQLKDSRAIFKKLDTNDDGKLSAAEMTRLPKVLRKQMLTALDRDGDGKVSKKEFRHWMKKQADQVFEQMDKHDNGELSAKELQPLMRFITQMNVLAIKSQSAHKDDKGKGHGHRHGPRHHFKQGPEGLPNTNFIFAMMDADHDGYVSEKEWAKSWKKWQKRYGAITTADSDHGKHDDKDHDEKDKKSDKHKKHGHKHHHDHKKHEKDDD